MSAHFAEAERLLNRAATEPSDNWPALTGELKSDILAAAQVHATLALALVINRAAASDSNGTAS